MNCICICLIYISICSLTDLNFDAVLFDVDSKDLSLGMSCPPKTFLAPEILGYIKKIIGPNGLFMLNLVCRDETLRAEAIANLQQVFLAVCCYKLDEDINEVIYCANNDEYKTIEQWKKHMGSAARGLNSAVKTQKFTNKDMLDVTEFLGELKL